MGRPVSSASFIDKRGTSCKNALPPGRTTQSHTRSSTCRLAVPRIGHAPGGTAQPPQFGQVCKVSQHVRPPAAPLHCLALLGTSELPAGLWGWGGCPSGDRLLSVNSSRRIGPCGESCEARDMDGGP